MEKELRKFIEEKNLSPWNKTKTFLKPNANTLLRTSDAKAVFTKVMSILSKNLVFADTANIWQCFPLNPAPEEIDNRQNFFRSIAKENSNEPLKKLKSPRPIWKPSYGVIIATENEKIFTLLKQKGCPVKYIISEYDVQSLERYDLVQVIDCEDFSHALENLTQAIFLKNPDEAYLERYLEILSGWKENLEILQSASVGESIRTLVQELSQALPLISETKKEFLTRELIEKRCGEMNRSLSQKIKEMTIPGSLVFEMLSQGKIPAELESLVKKEITSSGLPQHLFTPTIPIQLDEQALNKFLQKQNSEENSSQAEKIKKQAAQLQKIPALIKKLETELLLFDFESNVAGLIQGSTSFPQLSHELSIVDSKNIFLEKPSPITFYLNESERCSILTGANSGGKTTLLEHILQLLILAQLGLPTNGEIKLPNFSEVYYFAKNKGSMSKGAFETLLTQMSEIKPGRQTLILADEIESVTEPGMASAIVRASAEYFINQNCFLVIATHLGQEIQKNLPPKARIDGIEARGLDENFELVVNHAPVLGRLANSTPELIVERMANAFDHDYFKYLHSYLLREKNGGRKNY